MSSLGEMADGGERPHQAQDELPERTIVLVFDGVLAFAMVLILVSWWLLYVDEGVLRPSHRFVEKDLPAMRSAVQVVADEVLDGVARGQWMNEAARTRIGRFEWVDRKRGIIQIPVDRAIDLYLSQPASQR